MKGRSARYSRSNYRMRQAIGAGGWLFRHRLMDGLISARKEGRLTGRLTEAGPGGSPRWELIILLLAPD